MKEQQNNFSVDVQKRMRNGIKGSQNEHHWDLVRLT